ncbi:MAG: hypothetical protein J5785_05085 [Spirochaetales bacterium]|nr:hypothetical protein [Spirochaetales bacterium]
MAKNDKLSPEPRAGRAESFDKRSKCVISCKNFFPVLIIVIKENEHMANYEVEKFLTFFDKTVDIWPQGIVPYHCNGA